MQTSQIREALARRLRLRHIDNLWAYLVEKRYVDEVLDGAMSFDNLVAAAKEILAAGRPSVSSVETVTAAGPRPGEARSWALSMLVAAEAERHESVVRFRKVALGGVMLTHSDAADWIEDHPETSLPMTQDITITVEAGDVEIDGTGWLRLRTLRDRVRIIKTAVRVLDYAKPDGDWVCRVSVRAGEQLDWLRSVAETLAKQYSWQPAQATMFVLTGSVPLISRIRLTSHISPEGPWADRVLLDVDPAEAPAEVADAFASHVRARRQARSRPVQEKHARLAVHALVEHAGLPWKERTRLWNSEHPNWPYGDANYRRDALDTRNRLLRIHGIGGRGSVH